MNTVSGIRGPHRVLGSQEVMILLIIRHLGVASMKEIGDYLNKYVSTKYKVSGVASTIYRMEQKGWLKTSVMIRRRYVGITESGYERLNQTLQCINTLQNL